MVYSLIILLVIALVTLMISALQPDFRDIRHRRNLKKLERQLRPGRYVSYREAKLYDFDSIVHEEKLRVEKTKISDFTGELYVKYEGLFSTQTVKGKLYKYGYVTVYSEDGEKVLYDFKVVDYKVEKIFKKKTCTEIRK